MKVVFTGESPTKAKLFANLAEVLRTNKCASDRTGAWSPTVKASKVAQNWANQNNLQHTVVKQQESTEFQVILGR